MRNAHFTALQVHTSGAFLQGFVIRVMQETPVAKSNTAEVHKAFFSSCHPLIHTVLLAADR